MKNILEKLDEEIIPYEVIDHAIIKWVKIENMSVPFISTELSFIDRWETVKVRLGINRDDYKVPTGLYGIGNPKIDSDILVTCNYKLTFDQLRNDLKNQDLWLLILDTKGVNVWCAAGKGTFSSKELIYQLDKWKVKELLKNNRIILPQLGAPSIEPHKIKKIYGVDIEYGPIRSSDFISYKESDYQATSKMRLVSFNLRDRMVLTPLEFINHFKYFLYSLVIVFILNVLGFGIDFIVVAPVLLSLIVGTFLFPMLLPFLPFRSFSLNGMLLGVPITAMIVWGENVFRMPSSIFLKLGYAIINLCLVSYLSFNFTGSTTFTSLSGVKIESKYFKVLFKIGIFLSLVFLLIGLGVDYFGI